MKITINGEAINLDIDPETPLVWAIRDHLGLTGTKFGCGGGYCGACTVHVEGKATRSCITPLETVADKAITTIEGMPQNGELHPVQAAFLEHQVPQCSWCMVGQMMTAAAFLAENNTPTEAEIVNAMGSNYCRCGCYVRIKAAVTAAAETMQEAN